MNLAQIFVGLEQQIADLHFLYQTQRGIRFRKIRPARRSSACPVPFPEDALSGPGALSRSGQLSVKSDHWAAYSPA